jgi:phosphoribosylanthranilate isomerase
MINIKVNGVTELKQLSQLDGLGIDFAGLVFAGDSTSLVTGKLKAADARKTDLDIKKVGVFNNPEIADVLAAIDDYGLDVVELRGEEDPTLCEDLSTEVEVIKSFRIAGANADLDGMVGPYDAVCDYYLFVLSGAASDWKQLKKSRIEKPFFLAGNFGVTDTEKLKSFQHPDFFGVEIDEQFEKNSGVKDLVAVLQFKQGLKK